MGFPGWHLWFKGKPGAYQLELIEEKEIANKPKNYNIDLPISGRFVIKYFPNEKDPLFNTFSYYEQLICTSNFFDNTETPTWQSQNLLHPSYFIIGYINVRTNLNRDILEIECAAPQYWKDIRVDGLTLNINDNNEYQAAQPGGVDRNVPGWELCFFLFDKLFSGCCYVHKQKPIIVALAKAHGRIFMIDAIKSYTRKQN